MASPVIKREIDVEGLLAWAIGTEHADTIIEYTMKTSPDDYGEYAGSCLRTMEYYGFLGHVDKKSGRYRFEVAQCHVDAETIYMAARGVLAASDLGLIRDKGLSNTRPNWCPFPIIQVVPEYIVTNDRRLRVRVRRPGGRGAFCPVRFVDRGNELMAWRLVYTRWYDALLRVEAVLIGVELDKWRLVPLAVPARPWEVCPA